ncbi:hypothetical protein LSAT2_002509, partial [Lamellibrachia satsuma]
LYPLVVTLLYPSLEVTLLYPSLVTRGRTQSHIARRTYVLPDRNHKGKGADFVVVGPAMKPL